MTEINILEEEDKYRLKPLKLTKRERGVADLVSLGYEPVKIANTLYIAPVYVYELIRRVKGKYSANNTYHLIVMLVEERIRKRNRIKMKEREERKSTNNKINHNNTLV